MSYAGWLSLPSRVVLAGVAALLSVGVVSAQSSSFPETSHNAAISATESSSTDFNYAASDPDASPSPAPAAGGGQYDNKASSSSSGWKGKLAFEVGGGFNIPTSETSPYINTGYQINAGGGFHLSKMVSLLAMYQFIGDGMPSNIAAQAGVDGGNVHIWSFTLNPIVNLMPHHNTSVYVTGGGGFYRKTTNFQVLSPEQFCSYFYCSIGYVPQTVGSFSSNQGGWSVGGGVSHRFAGAYGDGKMALFAEARYLDVLSPAILNQSPNGLNPITIGEGTKLVPVSFGLRF
ncbi:outer membrane beta-barrel protein [Occallatibacter riparius]|uniref:Outer membrane beta-barrel protein n=1 Tax=Occallatibacter riparius TaxID=1002689 RepID=A0A9J7BWX6_9BACT|nr:outer membrane beta-barrel protein [Occallatibacter riparius]UWZ86338.1 outer membrane beta-barrel protein [Occallatibacter riparius]